MKIKKISIIVLIISCFLLNSTFVLGVSTNVYDSVGVEKVLKSKDEVIEQKFQIAKKWISELTPTVNQFFSYNFNSFKKQMDKVFNEIIEMINDVKNRNHTLISF